MVNKTALHLVYEGLVGRLDFSSEEKRTYDRLMSGYVGESLFHRLMSEMNFKHETLFDYSFSYQGNEGQIDVLIFTKMCVYHLELKHYAGAYSIDSSGRWQLNNGAFIQNPLLQVRRANDLLTMLMQGQRIPLKVESYLIFTHPTFQLFNADKNLPIIYPNQIETFLKRLERQAALTDWSVIERVRAHEIEGSKYEVFPKYAYENLQKGLFCGACRRRLVRKSQKKMWCQACGKDVLTREAFLIALREFKLLFPDRAITNLQMRDWIGGELEKSTIRRQLKKHCKLIPKARASYYK